MTDAYVIQIGGSAAGIVARNADEHSFSFFAAARHFFALEGRRFAAQQDAEIEARRLYRQPARPIRMDETREEGAWR